MENGGDEDKSGQLAYFHFMIGQLNQAIQYSDSKHTLGMTLVVSILFASKEFLFNRLDLAVYEVSLMLDVNVGSALAAIALGYVGIFPKFISPSFPERKSKRKGRPPNLFFFKEISESGLTALKESVSAAFPHSKLSPRYQEDSIIEIYALSQIAMRKYTTFRLFLYALFVFLVTLSWLYVTTLIDLSAARPPG